MTDIALLYAGYFNRAPDPVGLKFWEDQIDGGRPFNTIAADFAAGFEAKGLYPFLTTPTPSAVDVNAFVNSVYQNLFNRGPDAEGLSFWSGVIQAGTVPVGDMIQSIIQGATDAPTATPPTFDKATTTNKAVAGLDFAADAAAKVGFTYDAAAAAAAAAVMTTVTNDPATVAAAAAQTDAFFGGTTGGTPTENVGVTINLTTGTEMVSPNQANPAFKSTADADTINAPANTFTSGINIDGGGSTDSLFAIRTIGGTVTPTLSNVEKLFVTGQAGGTTVDLSNATGLTEVWSKDTNFPGAFVDFNNIKVGTNIGVEGPGDNIFKWDASAAPGAVDVTTLFVKEATNNQIGIDKDIDTINLQVEGASSLRFLDGNTFESAFTTMNVAGTGNLTLTAMPDTIRVFDASGLNGSVNASDMFSTNGVKVTGSAQTDTFALQPTNNAVDTIVYNNSNVSTSNSRDTYTGFDSAAEDKIDVSAFGVTGGKGTTTTFTSTPTDGASFAGNAVAIQASTSSFYVDINSDGIFNVNSDLAVTITGAAANLDVSDFIF